LFSAPRYSRVNATGLYYRQLISRDHLNDVATL
jgi:hypothetical protein